MPAPDLARRAEFPQAHLLAKDFDGTVAQTFEKSPSGIDVEEAYIRAIDQVFGVDAVDDYIKSGGLHNRSPREVVEALLPHVDEAELSAFTELLNEAKLKVLTGEIGTRFDDGQLWPRLTTGYAELKAGIEQAKAEGRPVNDAVISSGHTAFIAKTYQVHDLQPPDYFVTTETMVELGLSHVVKPSSTIMNIALNIWHSDYDTPIEASHPSEARSRTMYVGDGMVDQQLANNSGIRNFQRITPENAPQVWAKAAKWLKIDGASNGAQ